MPTLPLAEFVTVWTLLALNIMTPGPNVLNTIVLAIGSGRGAGMGSAMGVGLGIGLWCLGTSLGLAAVFNTFPLLKPVMTVVAVGLLLWFASRYARQGLHGLAARRTNPDWTPTGKSGVTLRGAFARSMAINASNPKALTTWLAVLSISPLRGQLLRILRCYARGPARFRFPSIRYTRWPFPPPSPHGPICAQPLSSTFALRCSLPALG